MDLRTRKKRELSAVIAYASLAALCVPFACGTALSEAAKKPYYTEEPLCQLRPNPDQEEIIYGEIGVSGLLIAPTHHVQLDTPMENFWAMMDTIKA